jgi:hypothetical protein
MCVFPRFCFVLSAVYTSSPPSATKQFLQGVHVVFIHFTNQTDNQQLGNADADFLLGFFLFLSRFWVSSKGR